MRVKRMTQTRFESRLSLDYDARRMPLAASRRDHASGRHLLHRRREKLMKPTAIKLAFTLAFVASAWTAEAQTSMSVCNDPAYVALRAMPVDSLTEREWELYRIHHEACLNE